MSIDAGWNALNLDNPKESKTRATHAEMPKIPSSIPCNLTASGLAFQFTQSWVVAF